MEDKALHDSALIILSAMLASGAHVETPMKVLVEKSISAAALLLHTLNEGK